MTREEAIDTLNAIKAIMKIYPKREKQKESVSQINTALDMAIESLSKDQEQLDIFARMYKAERETK